MPPEASPAEVGVLRCKPLAQPDTLIVVEQTNSTAAFASPEEHIGRDGTPSPAACPSPTPSCANGSPHGGYERLDAEAVSWLRSWKQGESLGRGAYGEVFKAMVAGRFMAVKKIPLDLSLQEKAAEKEISVLLLEINTLKRLKHPRIVRYMGCIRQDSDHDPALLIFLEFMPSGSIKAMLTKFGSYGEGLVRKYTRQILEGLEFLHQNQIVHRDVKGANILIDPQGDAKLADFGACGQLKALQDTVTGGMKSIQGSVFWMAPEVMKYKAGRRSDIWSLGCTVIEMITAEAPWPNLRQEKLSVTEMLKRIVEGPDPPPMPDNIPSACRSFLTHSLARDHTKRPYADKLLKHRFIVEDAARVGSAKSTSSAPQKSEAWGALGPGPTP